MKRLLEEGCDVALVGFEKFVSESEGAIHQGEWRC